MKTATFVLLFIISFSLAGCSPQKPEGKQTIMCKESCEEKLAGISRVTNFDPISICQKECQRTQGNCPASDGSGDSFTGCQVYGTAGGLSTPYYSK